MQNIALQSTNLLQKKSKYSLIGYYYVNKLELAFNHKITLIMKNKCFELPTHFSRREFMHVGLVGGLGLTLADFMKIKAHGASEIL